LNYRPPAPEKKPHVDVLNKLDIEEDYILSSHLIDWQQVFESIKMNEYNQDFNLKRDLPGVYKQIFEAIRRGSLTNGSGRAFGWCLLLGIT
jgi:hypothetical protein